MAASNDYFLFADKNLGTPEQSPLLYWLLALSIKTFGANTIAVRLPVILAALAGIYATWRLARLLYSETTAKLAAVVLATTQGWLLWSAHNGPEIILAATIITALWCFRAFELTKRWPYFLGATAAIALGILTKGIIALLVPMAALGMHWALRHKWQRLFSPRHLLSLLLILLLVLPFFYGIWQRSGMGFQQWLGSSEENGALPLLLGTTAENPSAPDAGSSMLLFGLATLTALLPWALITLTATGMNLQKLAKRNFQLRQGREFLSTGGFLAALLLAAIFFYDAPVYLSVALPLGAIPAGRLVNHLVTTNKYPKLRQSFMGLQTLIATVLLLTALTAIVMLFPAGGLAYFLWIAGFLVWLIISIKNKSGRRLLWTTVSATVIFQAFLLHFYFRPFLSREPGPAVGRYLHERQVTADQACSYGMVTPLYTLDFYTGQNIPARSGTNLSGKAGDYLLLPKASLSLVSGAYDVVLSGQPHGRDRALPLFLSHGAAEECVKAWCLIKFK